MRKQIKKTPKNPTRLILSVAVVCAVAVLLLTGRYIQSDSTRYVFLIWNLALAAIAPLLAWWLVYRVQKYGWLKWQQVALTIGWLAFLPNSFYIITDYIHLRQTYEVSILFDVVVITSFVMAGLILGYMSVYTVHKELQKRLSVRYTWMAIGGIFLASSFAIYLGRFSRWNTWDIFLKPAGLLFDVSDRVVNPIVHFETYAVTGTFFVLLFAVYWVVWEAIAYAQSE